MNALQSIREFLTTKLISVKSLPTQNSGKTGASVQTPSSPVSKPSVEQSPGALPISEPKASSIETPIQGTEMSAFSLVQIAEAVGKAFTAVEVAYDDFNRLKTFAIQLMDSAQTAYAGAQNAGQSKLKSVLAGVEALAGVLGITWSSSMVAALTTFITLAKAAYNAIVDAGKAVVAAAPAMNPVASVVVASRGAPSSPTDSVSSSIA